MGLECKTDLQELFFKAREAIAEEKSLAIETVKLIGALNKADAAVGLDMSEASFIKALGLSPDQYYKRLAAFRAIEIEPRFLTLLEEGRTFISHLALVSPKLTCGNAEVILGNIANMSKRELRFFLDTVDEHGNRHQRDPKVSLTFEVSEELFEKIERARQLMAGSGRTPSYEEVVDRLCADHIERHDPVRKAERAARRAEKKAAELAPGQEVDQELAPAQDVVQELAPGQEVVQELAPGQEVVQELAPAQESAPGRKPIPASLRHQIFRRDQGQCTYKFANGERCCEKHMLELDHIVPVARGGENSVENLRLLCRKHNQSEAKKIFGERFMEQKSGGRGLEPGRSVG